MLNMFSPANDTALAILSPLIETLVYGFVIIWLVVFLLFTILGVFSIDDPVDDEEHDIVYLGHLWMFVSGWKCVFILFAYPYQEIYTRSWIIDHRAATRSIPQYFTKRVESLLDIFFLAMPTIIVILISVPTLGFLYSNECMYKYTNTAFSIDVIGHQWYWSYEYHWNGKDDMFDFAYDSIPDVDAVENINSEVDKRLVIPTDVRISVTITSTDVIHSWAVPQLGIKVDAVPGRLANTVLHSLIRGVFYGQCPESCGVLHGFMPICVESVPLELFLYWTMLHYEDCTSSILRLDPLAEAVQSLLYVYNND